MSRFAMVRYLSCAVLLSACNEKMALEDLPAEQARAYCDALRSCRGALAGRFDDELQCDAALGGMATSRDLPLLRAIVDEGTAIYDPAAAASCVSAIRELDCDATAAVAFWGGGTFGAREASAPASCRAVFTGTLAEGSPCRVDEECAGDSYCAGVACPYSRGTCMARKFAGQSCFSPGDCQAGLFCNASHICATPMSGQTCSDGGVIFANGCPLNQVCQADETGGGTCVPVTEAFHHALGESCDIQRRDLCAPNLSCAVTDPSGAATCVATAPSSGSCYLATPDMCPNGEYCNVDVGTGEGTCVPLPTEGQPCVAVVASDVSNGFACAAGLVCVSGMCVAQQPNGSSCTSLYQCQSWVCDRSVCGATSPCM